MVTYSIEYLTLPNGKAPVIEWLNSLDSITRKRIVQRILRIEDGNFGDYKKLSDEIFELRFSFGKGYRVYYTVTNSKLSVISVCGVLMPIFAWGTCSLMYLIVHFKLHFFSFIIIT